MCSGNVKVLPLFLWIPAAPARIKEDGDTPPPVILDFPVAPPKAGRRGSRESRKKESCFPSPACSGLIQSER